MRYCQNCILPDTRPDLEIDADGICSACRSHGRKTSGDVDWDKRAERFRELVDQVRSLDRRWDCVVPVSGGKDSHWQVVTCLEHGLHPLAVTWRTPARTDIGERNLRNLVELGVDHIDFQVNPTVERKMLLRSLERYGTTAIPMHLAIFNIPLTVATRYDVPLVVWGENSAVEYTGTDEDAAASHRLDSAWVKRYGAVHGTTAHDWLGDGLTERDLAAYVGPSDEELERKGIEAVFLGFFFEWDPQTTFEVARAHGFESAPEARTGLYEFADIDDDFISIHHWLKWYKFGFTRTFDNLSLEIRNGRLTRDEAIEILREHGDDTPMDDIEVCCEYMRISTDEFFAICERFRNTDVWTRRDDGTWVIEDFLIPDWQWN